MKSEAGSLQTMNEDIARTNLGGNHEALSTISPAGSGHSWRRPSMKPFQCKSRDRNRRAGIALMFQSLLFAGSLMAAPPLGLAADQKRGLAGDDLGVDLWASERLQGVL